MLLLALSGNNQLSKAVPNFRSFKPFKVVFVLVFVIALLGTSNLTRHSLLLTAHCLPFAAFQCSRVQRTRRIHRRGAEGAELRRGKRSHHEGHEKSVQQFKVEGST